MDTFENHFNYRLKCLAQQTWACHYNDLKLYKDMITKTKEFKESFSPKDLQQKAKWEDFLNLLDKKGLRLI